MTVVRSLAFTCALGIALSSSPRPLAALDTRHAPTDITGVVTDSVSGQPLPSADILVTQNGSVVATANVDPFGRFTLHNLGAGSYQVMARAIGFRPVTRTVTVTSGGADIAALNFQLGRAAVSLGAVQVTASVPIAVDTRTGDQVFKQDDYHGAPTHTTSQILQESIAGAARAPTGEVHIRGQHAEYTYYIDGVPVPSGISGSLNELFDPTVVDKINFQTGGWDAEYGNKNAAIVNVQTRIPAGGFHGDVGGYAGMYDSKSTTGTRAFNGQSLTMSTNSGPWGYFISGARQQSDMRREPLVDDPAAGHVINFHNDGNDYFGFGKIQFTPNANDVVSLDLNDSRTKFSVPYDSTGGVFNNDHQTDVNSFANLGWRHLFGGTNPGEFFGAVFYRHGSLDYVPDAADDPQFVFAPDTATKYNLSEARQFNTTGVKVDYLWNLQREFSIKVGTLSSITRGKENFQSIAADGSSGPSSNSTLKGSDLGLYAQTSYAPTELAELRLGVRYDQHIAPFAGTQSQVSPRVRLNLYPSSGTTVYLYYGRMFMPTNVEDLRAITSSALGPDATPDATLPERDNFYEAGVIQRLAAGTTVKVSAYKKESTPGIDDNTIPGSAIVTSVNIDKAHITGIEGVIEMRPGGPFSAYLNAALNHAWGTGPITGGFFPADAPPSAFDLDHDQRLSIVGTGTYSINRIYISGTEIYGSGLTNGQDPDASYGTGLLDFNKSIKVSPSAITNVSAGYSLVAGGKILRPQLFIENVFNKQYLLKGTFFSGPSVGRPRSVQLRFDVSM